MPSEYRFWSLIVIDNTPTVRENIHRGIWPDFDMVAFYYPLNKQTFCLEEEKKQNPSSKMEW